jgi:protein-S-isoprenylcysteine O-methyltransferase Ste14
VLIKLMSVIGYLGMFAGLVGLIAVRGLFSLFPLVILAQIAAIMLWVWARLAFGRRSFHLAANPTKGDLVTSGPYRFIRHPVYAAVCLFVWAGALAPHSLTALLLAALVTAGALLRIFCEERLLVKRFPEYRQYASSTKRLIPYLF